ncbi:MAG: homocysteine biosynthesis protein [Methanocellales archaeon]|nr:homocysteine biosynthesis protein [Methanocellales archaeon]MDD3421318.1 homocysteine biosynthesis protein [Methanocellales archaeon]MDD4898682.1 homocysteine biosynthesis protein [Methanocellales archaeon]MDD5446941.1 homocysteine biosynthesis protein [Methanocellales archaeon]
MVEKTVQDINQKIKDGSVHVVTAEQMTDIVEELGPEDAAREVDVVTTGTFGAMCSSGAFLNFGHSDPPIKMQKVWLNDVEAYTGIAAVDAYIGATQLSESRGMEYGGGHVIEDLVARKSVHTRAVAYGTDCYPRKNIETAITIDDLNQAIMLNPRNAYQRYNVAINSSDRTLYTYMGTLLPNYGNATYSGAGVLSPLYNDPDFETIGRGSKIFLCGAHGYIIGEGTQHEPQNDLATIMVTGNLKEMSREFLRGAAFHGYGATLYVGLGIPIPILNENIAKKTGISDADIVTNVLDYSFPKRSRPTLRKVSYEELKSGMIELDGKEVRTSPLSSFFMARKVASTLKHWIEQGNFMLSQPMEKLPTDTIFGPMKQTKETPLVKDVMSRKMITIRQGKSVEDAAKLIMRGQSTHLPVTSEDDRLIGIITAWDISKAVAQGKYDKLDRTMTRRVITATLDEPIDVTARKLEKHNISALPVIDKDSKVIGMITSDDISRLIAKRNGCPLQAPLEKNGR